jgi:hypothetical protein
MGTFEVARGVTARNVICTIMETTRCRATVHQPAVWPTDEP